MKSVATVIGASICGALVFGIWPEMWKSYGLLGGWAAAAILISIAWFMNHWLGVINNPEGRIFVDQGWAVGSAGVAWAIVRFGAEFQQCLPTMAFCLIGGVLGGLAAAAVKKTNPALRPLADDSQEL